LAEATLRTGDIHQPIIPKDQRRQGRTKGTPLSSVRDLRKKYRCLVKPFEVIMSGVRTFLLKPGAATPGIFHIRFIDLFHQAPECVLHGEGAGDTGRWRGLATAIIPSSSTKILGYDNPIRFKRNYVHIYRRTSQRR
jgi:hypothetical protein